MLSSKWKWWRSMEVRTVTKNPCKHHLYSKKKNLPYIELWCISSLKTLVTLYKAGYKSGTKECQGIDTRQYIRFT